MRVTIKNIDHLVLTVTDINRTCEFYRKILGMEVVTFGENRKALAFGNQKINLHEYGREISPHATSPAPGSADLCLISDTPLATIIAYLRENNVVIIEGPVRRTGAIGSLTSIYFRDPDGNLLEIANY
ncbi:MAG: VOC family protein [Proteobacteria bacterium]|nr:VOC family protein [Pseudomonadota bacterium]MBU1739833.1 VOC family protein [Pseudomonadota bacterium]